MKVGDRVRLKYETTAIGTVWEECPNSTWTVKYDNGRITDSMDRGYFEYVFEPLPPVPDAPPRALRLNEGKAQLFYADMFPDALREVCRTLMYGTQREVKPYPKFNWTRGAPYTELYDCARRHMQDWLNGAKNDRDAEEQKWKVHNLAFAIGNLMRLLQQELDGRTDLDDRGYRQGKEPSGEQGR